MRGKKNQGKQHPRHKDEIVFRKGARLTIPNHPTEFMSRPWFPVILRIDNPPQTLTLGQINGALNTQLALSGPAFSFRFLDVRLWGPLPVTANALILLVHDVFQAASVVSTSFSVLEQITNYGDAVNRARVGYRYSTAQQQLSIGASALSSFPLFVISGAGPTSVMYIKLLWRVNTSVPARVENSLYPNLPAYSKNEDPPGYVVV